MTYELIEISDGKTLYIGTELSTEQKEQVSNILQQQSGAFPWDYLDLKGIHPDTCIHHIYTNDEMRPIRKPRHLNPTLKEIVKDEL